MARTNKTQRAASAQAAGSTEPSVEEKLLTLVAHNTQLSGEVEVAQETIDALALRVNELETELERAILQIHGTHAFFTYRIEKCGNAQCQRVLAILPPRPWPFEVQNDPTLQDRQAEEQWKKEHGEHNEQQ